MEDRGIDPMRVCYIASQALGSDGWGRYTTEAALGAQARGIEPVLITASLHVDPALADVEHHPILPAPFSGRLFVPRTLLYIPAVRRILQTCDVVHCTTELYAPLAALARPNRMPYFVSALGTWSIRTLEVPTRRILFAYAFRQADIVLCLSRFTHDWMTRLIHLPRAQILTGGVHVKQFERHVEASLPGWVEQAPFVLSVGAVKPRKGQHVALEAFALARASVPNLHYVIIGSLRAMPDYATQLQRRADELGVTEWVHFLGQVPEDDLVAWYQRASVFLLTPINQGSSFEGLGLVYLEAAAAGAPSIGTRGCGVEEAIMDGDTGYLVPQNDPQATAEALIRLLRDPEQRNRMGEAARQFARRLSWDAFSEQLVALYNKTMRHRR